MPISSKYLMPSKEWKLWHANFICVGWKKASFVKYLVDFGGGETFSMTFLLSSFIPKHIFASENYEKILNNRSVSAKKSWIFSFKILYTKENFFICFSSVFKFSFSKQVKLQSFSNIYIPFSSVSFFSFYSSSMWQKREFRKK